MAKRRKKTGRPEHRPTKATREQVAVAAGGGMRHEQIALALGISRNTLEKHYEAELSTTAAVKRLEVKQALFKAAKKGRVAAIKAYLADEPEIAAPPLPKGEQRPAPAPVAAAEVKLEKLGKKDQAERDASTAHQNDPEWNALLGKQGDKPTLQ